MFLPREDYSGGGYCECLIRGKAERGVLVRLLAIFESRGIKVDSCSFESGLGKPVFGATLVLELRKKSSDSDMFALVEKLMDTRLVSSVEFAPLEGKAFTNFRFPIVILPEERGVIVQPQILIDCLVAVFHGNVASSLEAGRRYGSLLASHFSSQKTVGTAIQALKATGWGIGKYEENEKGKITFALSDPVIGIESELESRSRFLVGMIQGMLENICGYPMILLGDGFDGKTNSLIVRLAKSDISKSKPLNS